MLEKWQANIDGRSLKVDDIFTLVNHNSAIKISDESIDVVRASQLVLNQHVEDKIVYGINTGFGPMASHIIGKKLLVDLQYNLIRSHAVGMGEPIDQRYVLAAMIVRLNGLLKGYSGVSFELLEKLRDFINLRIIPIVPEHGAVGTSGDLVQLAHIALALIGEGEVNFRDQRLPTAKVLRQLKIKPYKLQPKEGLSLINGTSVMTGIAAILTVHAWRLLGLAVRNGAMALEQIHGFSDGISEGLHSLRPHPGQVNIARSMRVILSSSKLLRDRSLLYANNHANTHTHVIPEDVQEVYSLRCIPQILGPIFDTIQKTRRDVEIEINSVTDNPIIDAKAKLFLHGGNFHGDYIAASVDQLKAALVKLTILSERRINFLLNRRINKQFPAFLNLKTPGLTLGLQGLQFVATSTTAQSQSLAYPHHLHSISTNGDNQDVVSMGTDASLLAAKVVENAYTVLTIEQVALAQLVDHLKHRGSLSKSSQELYREVRKKLPVITEDRYFAGQLDELVRHFRDEIPSESLVIP